LLDQLPHKGTLRQGRSKKKKKKNYLKKKFQYILKNWKFLKFFKKWGKAGLK
jgi:hypothetical protein